MGILYSHYLIPRDNTLRPEPDQIVALIEAWLERGFLVRPENITALGQHTTSDGTPGPNVRFMTKSVNGEPPAAPAPEPRTGFWRRLWGGAQQAPRPDPWMPFSVPPVGESLSALANPYTLIRWNGNSSATYPLQTITEAIHRGDYWFPHRLMIELCDDFIHPETDPYGAREGEARQINPICNCGCNLGYRDDGRGWLAVDRIRRICPTCGRSFRPQDQLAEIVEGATGNKSPQPGGFCNRFGIIIDFEKQMPLYVPDARGELMETTPQVSSSFMQTCSTALGIDLNEFSYYS